MNKNPDHIFIGIDPDLHDTAIAAIKNGKVHRIYIAKTPIKKKQREAVLNQTAQLTGLMSSLDGELMLAVVGVAVEGQEIVYSARKGVNPRDMVLLAGVAGAALGLSRITFPEAVIAYPLPATWKGQVPKHIHQTRTAMRLGWNYRIAGSGDHRYVVPKDSREAEALGIGMGSEWKHAMDAIGLAFWAEEQYKRACAIAELRAGRV